MMPTIETTQVETYTRNILSDRSMHPAVRAQHAAAALMVHVATGYGLLLDAPMQIEQETIDEFEALAQTKAALLLNDLHEQAFEPFNHEDDSVRTEFDPVLEGQFAEVVAAEGESAGETR